MPQTPPPTPTPPASATPPDASSIPDDPLLDHAPTGRLALEDGSIFLGRAFGCTEPRLTEGEVCFNTSLGGYQEVFTDPSYAGQIVTMTCPQIGNYGVNDEDIESRGMFARGFIVRELSAVASNYRAARRLEELLARHGVTGLTGVDTRALTRKLRIRGALNGVLCTDPDRSDAELVQIARANPGVVGIDMVSTVTCRQPQQWREDWGAWAPLQGDIEQPSRRYNVVAIDCGVKLNILRSLVASGCDLTVVGADTPAEAILEHRPDGIFVSSGPGDPAAVTATVENLGKLVGKAPVFGICLGLQLLALSLGADSFKLKFGHRGGNQPVQNLHTRKVEITSQNHGFAIDTASLEKVGGEPTHINLNDQTLEGFRLRDRPLFAVQYHPEASPGPHDSRYLFDCFIDMMNTNQSPTGEQMDTAQRRRNQIAAR